MKRNKNPVTLFSLKEGAKVENTLFKAKWEVVPKKLAALLKRNFPLETFFSEFLRSRSLEVLGAASYERLYNKVCLSKVNTESNDTCRCPQNSCFRRCSTN